MKPMFDVVKYDCDGNTLIYRHPVEDFNTRTQLVVQQSQEAIFYYKGEIADIFDEPGTYTLHTENIPILRRLVNLPFGGESPFHAVVYFVDKTERMQIKWGTSEKVGIIEPTYGVPMEIGASGEMSIRIADCELVMDRLVGNQTSLTHETFVNGLRAIIQTSIKTCLAKTFAENKFNLFTIETELKNLSALLKDELSPEFDSYGMALETFLVTNILKPETDQNYQRIAQMFFDRTAGMESIKIQNEQERIRMEFEFEMQMRQQDVAARGVVVDADAQEKRRRIEGIDSITERAFRVAELTAQNEGAGNFASMGMGVGMGLGIGTSAGESVGRMYTDALSNLPNTSNQINLPQEDFSYVGDMGLGALFEDSTDSVNMVEVDNAPLFHDEQSEKELRRNRLKELKEYFEDGMIDEEEYKSLKQELLKALL